MESNLNRIQVLQNRAIRNISKGARLHRLDNYCLIYRILKLCDLHDLEMSKFMHGHYTDTYHAVLIFFQLANNRCNRNNAANRKHCIPYFRSTRGQRSIIHFRPKIWNQRPMTFHEFTKSNFKNNAKIIYYRNIKFYVVLPLLFFDIFLLYSFDSL